MLNRFKSTEVIFTDPKRKSRQHPLPTSLPDISRASSVKILGVTFTNHLLVSLRVHSVTSSCDKHLYALKLLRVHGLCEEALQQVFRAVIIPKICHAASAWWGFTSATDRQHLKAFLCRSVRSRLCHPELFDLTELIEAADDKLFQLTSRTITLCLVFYLQKLTVVITCTRNVITENYYRKTLICLIAILLFGYFIKTVISYSPYFLTTHLLLHFNSELCIF